MTSGSTLILVELSKAAESVKTEIGTLDQKISALNHERQGLMDSPVSREDFAAYMKSDLARRGELFRQRIQQFATHAGRGNAKMTASFVTLERAFQSCGLQNFPFMDGEDCFDGFRLSADAFYFYFGDLIAARFMAGLDAVHDWPQGGLPVAERRQRIAEIDCELDDLVTRRDELAEQLLSVGITG